MAGPVCILLPPSEGKAPGGSGSWSPGSGRFAALGPTRRTVAAALAAAMEDDAAAAAVTGVRGAAFDRARASNLAALGAPVLPAARRYTGVVWDHLDLGRLRGRAAARAADVVVVSALAGLAGVEDPLPDYKCRMGARLPGLPPLAAYWRPVLTAALDRAVAGGTVWDLLPLEHRRAVDLEQVAANGTRVLRVEFLAGDGRAAGHDAKAVKGRFARHLLGAPTPTTARSLAGLLGRFAWDGWSAAAGPDGLVVVRR